MELDDVIAVIATILYVLLVVLISWLGYNNYDWSHEDKGTYVTETQEQEPTRDYKHTSETSCSILASSCLVHDWEPICMIKECIFY